MGRSRSRSNSRKKSKKSKKVSRKYSSSDSRSRSRSRTKRSKKYRSDSYKKDVERSSSSKFLDSYRPKNESSDWLFLKEVEEDIDQEQIEIKFQDASIQAGTSMPEEVRYVDYMNQVFIQYPSKQIATKVLYFLKGKIMIQNKQYIIDYYVTEQEKTQSLRTSIPAYLDSTQDWICENCDFKNFAKRSSCHKCKKDKSEVCKAHITTSSSLKQYQQFVNNQQQQVGDSNTSVIVKGIVIATSTEEEIHDAFSKFTAVKEIRLIRNKNPSSKSREYKDFCFVDFFTTDDTEKVLQSTQKSFKIKGQEVTVQISRSKKDENGNYISVTDSAGQQQSQQLQYQYFLQQQQASQQEPVISESIVENKSSMPILDDLQLKNQKKELTPEMQEKMRKIKEQQEINKKLKEEQEKILAEQEKQKQIEKEKKDKAMKEQKKLALSLKKFEQELQRVNQGSSGNNNEEQQQQQQVQQQQVITQQQQMQQLRGKQTNEQLLIQQMPQDSLTPMIDQSELPLLIICSICKRKFPSEENLKIHEKMSELHKANWKKLELEKY